MMPKQEQTSTVVIPPAPRTKEGLGNAWRPDQVDAELANIAIAKLLIEKYGLPSKISPEFNIRKAILLALNHTEKNKTGIDCTLRIKLYEAYEQGTVNEGGSLFTSIWAFLMKPKYIMSGYAGMPESKESEPAWYMKLLGLGKRKEDESGSK
jgi:hypothetical protein